MPFHWSELIIVGVIALLIFGPKRLPEIGSSIGKTIKEFQRSMREVTNPSANDPALPPAPRADATALPSASTSAAEAALTGSTSVPASAEPIKD